MENRTIQIMEGFPKEIIRKIMLREERRRKALPANLNGQPLQLVLEDLLLWDQRRLVVSFKNGNAELHRKIADTAAEWSKYANIELDFGYNPVTATYRVWQPGDTSSIRVGFEDPGYWSFVGTDSQDPEICQPGDITLNLQGFDVSLPENWRTTVLHEFGHALGFHHEHQSPAANCDFDWERLYAYLSGPPNFWSKEQVDYNLKQMPAGGLTYSPHDKQSIMHYSFPDWMFLSGSASSCYVQEPTSLSEQDKIMAAKAYPFNESAAEEQKLQRKDNITHLLQAGHAFSEGEYLHLNARANGLSAAAAMRHTYVRDDQLSLDLQVKKAILVAAGQSWEEPRNLGDHLAIGNLMPTDYAYQFLADLLDELVKTHNAGASVRIADVSGVDTVLDCVKMVKGKL